MQSQAPYSIYDGPVNDYIMDHCQELEASEVEFWSEN